MIYSVKFVNKFYSMSPAHAGGDICLSGEDISSPKLLAKALREQGILGKGEMVREYRLCSDGSLVVFPASRSVWHAIRLEPQGDWVAVDLR